MCNNSKFYVIDFEYFMKSNLDVSDSIDNPNGLDISNESYSLTQNLPSNNKNRIKTNNTILNKSNYILRNDIIDVKDEKENVDEKMIIKALEYFLKQHFLSNSDLNRTDLQKVALPYGNDSWNVHELIKHRATKQYTDILSDRYKIVPDSGKSTKIPFSFYFDLSGSMFEYNGLFIKMIDTLLSNGVSALFGYNEYIHDVLSDKTKFSNIDELIEIISSSYSSSYSKILDEFLIECEAEKVVVFADYDPFDAIVKLSKKALVYWFCFEKRHLELKRDLDSFNGLLYHTNNFEDFRRHINKIEDRAYETRQRILQKNIDSGGKHYDV